MAALRFEVAHTSLTTRARTGRITTPHGSFDTPAFMPVGTRGSVKGVLPEQLQATGAQIVLANTYHMIERPGPERVAKLGGLHGLMNWHGPILTDSGGFQAFSLSQLVKLTEEGVTFKCSVDGRPIHLTPEAAIGAQNLLGSDIIMAFDDCPPGEDVMTPAHRSRLVEAGERTIRWLDRCARAHQRPDDQALFGIVQGGTDLDLRAWSATRSVEFDLPGYAIGGVAVGEGTDAIARVVEHTAPLLPRDRPRYLMGVGYERDLVAAVRAGVDMFDCVLPTRNGRNANAFTPTGQIRLRNARFADDLDPIESGCDCVACAGVDGRGGFGRGAIRHFFMAGEMLGPILVTLHNLRYFQRLMLDVRRTIREDDWLGFARRWPVASPGIRVSVDGAGVPWGDAGEAEPRAGAREKEPG